MPPAPPPGRRPRVVIVGAGFGGLACARALAARPGRGHADRPAQLPPVPAAALPGGDRRPLAGRHRLADPRHPGATRPTPSVHARPGHRRRHGARARSSLDEARRVPYDYLVLATGARHAYFGHDEWADVRAGAEEDRRRHRDPPAHAAPPSSARRRPTDPAERGAPAHLRRGRRRADGRGDGRRHRRARPRTRSPATSAPSTRRRPASSWSRPARALLALLPGAALGRGAGARSSAWASRSARTRRVTACDAGGVAVGGGAPRGRHRRLGGGRAWPRRPRAGSAAGADRAGRVMVGPDLSVPGHPDLFAIGDTALSERPRRPPGAGHGPRRQAAGPLRRAG